VHSIYLHGIYSDVMHGVSQATQCALRTQYITNCCRIYAQCKYVHCMSLAQQRSVSISSWLTRLLLRCADDQQHRKQLHIDTD